MYSLGRDFFKKEIWLCEYIFYEKQTPGFLENHESSLKHSCIIPMIFSVTTVFNILINPSKLKHQINNLKHYLKITLFQNTTLTIHKHTSDSDLSKYFEDYAKRIKFVCFFFHLDQYLLWKHWVAWCHPPNTFLMFQ